MANEWREVTIGDIAASTRNALVGGPFGSNLVSRDYVDAGVPVIRGQNMGARWVVGDFAFVTEQKARALEANLARPGDVIFTQRGTMGQVSLVPTMPYQRYLVSQSQMKLTVDPERADPLYVYYTFLTQEHQDYIRRNAIQTGVPHTNLGILRATRILLPSLPEQQAIAHILGSLDDKIELNRRMSATLEEMARALFQAWFVDFAPVRAKLAGQATGLPDEVADLFPAALVASEVGEIPEGWAVVALPDAIEVNPSRSLAGIKSAPYLDMASMPTRGHRPEQWIERAVGSGMRFNNGDTLVARITPCLENGKTAFVDFLEDGQVGWGSTEYIVLGPKEPLPPPFAYYLARTEGFRTFAIQNMTGSSGRQRVPAECLKQFPIVMPPAQLAQRFGELAWGFMARIRVNSEQIKTLAALRDALLPKLIAGELHMTSDFGASL